MAAGVASIERPATNLIAASPLLVAEHVAKTYVSDAGRANAVIADISFSLAQAKSSVWSARQDAAKATLLNLLCGLMPLSAGQVAWRAEVAGMPERVGYMLQKDLSAAVADGFAECDLGTGDP